MLPDLFESAKSCKTCSGCLLFSQALITALRVVTLQGLLRLLALLAGADYSAEGDDIGR